MLKKTFFLLFVLFGVFSFGVNAQKALRKAELQFNNGKYQEAAETYKSYLKDNSEDINAILGLGIVQAKLGEFSEAEKLLSSVPESQIWNPDFYKIYGNVLVSKGEYAKAKEKFQLYKAFHPEEGEILYNNCDKSLLLAHNKPSYDAMVVPSNSSSSDFGLTFFKGLPVISSFRNDFLLTESERMMNTENDSHRSYVYNDRKSRLTLMKLPNEKINHVGPVSFADNGKSLAVIESNLSENYTLVNPSVSSSLYIASLNDKGEVESYKAFPYNEVGASTHSMHLAYDGNALYFASNRQGGFGGYDIYVSYLSEGKWSLPENLGAEINSSGNEITPYLEKGTLYFASDFYYGLGGYDIFKSNVISGVWSIPENMGNGINSMGDDYYPCLKNDAVYFTSNRLGGKGGNDIYKAIKIMNSEPEMLVDVVPPPAVSLEKLEAEVTQHTGNPEAGAMVAHKEVAFKLPDFDPSKVGAKDDSENASWVGAHRVSVGELIQGEEVFFIQLASISASRPNFNQFRPLVKYGNIYKMYVNRSIKVRLGYFNDRSEAEQILTMVRSNGYKDAFITYESLNTATMELILSGKDHQSFSDEGNFNTRNPEVAKDYMATNKYKVRLASYEDPIWFDISKVKDLGRIEQWTKGGWTIFILAGYQNIDDAKSAMIQARNRGFKTAEIVIDNNGILERLKQN
ncbi:MAG: tetratricopeptide repeat protein [Saprospiraceae bacterium]